MMAWDKRNWRQLLQQACGTSASLTQWMGEEDEEEEPPGPVTITRLHNFQTHMPHRWQCTNNE